MKHLVRLRCCLITIGLLGMSLAHAQCILAGQTAGATYVDVVPDKRLSATLAGDHSQKDSLDLDGDGRFDLQFRVSLSTSLYPNVMSSVRALHDDVALAQYTYVDYVKNYLSRDTIQQRLVNAFPALSIEPVWVDKASIKYDYSAGRLTYKTGSPGGPQGSGLWLDGKDGYTAVRLRTTALGPWRYGWVRLQVLPAINLSTNDYSEVTILVKDYAFTTTVLATWPASAAGWQLTPIPTAERLTVTAPAATTGQLVLRDVCGRVCLAADFAGKQQQLDLSTLAAGVYVLRITTAAGSLVQRVVKH
ncbi:T9SS type A sorting domain-containing protein [Hymenobacter cheonanensis]|uniref:T9SS type A sorting domain-containing protein n=1 Tax=Hymenobacter sp. CA2-7 TaxID=3063993 RepID=UPI002712F994|nr:T9SS type A sorting domain-containing protein [Hymenobacter sp. CA2-7]MDO7887408.1 T9SS type A sorting domain-containing protein [Hymenobacter sp. CA2-7]